MKHRLLFLLILLSVPAIAQERPAGICEHVISVYPFPNYGKGYLTVTDTHFYKMGEEKTPVNVTFDYAPDIEGELNVMDVILEVDGVSAKGWDAERFYRAVDGRKDPIELKIKTHKDGKIVSYKTAIVPRYELADNLKIWSYALSNNSLINKTDLMERAGNTWKFTVRSDSDFDFFNVCYYDILINDPLRDKELVKNVDFNWVKRYVEDEEGISPQVLITVAKNSEQRIESIYVPPTSRDVVTGSSSTSTYNARSNQTYTTSYNSVRTIHEAGYTKQLTNTDMFLEIAALDCSKIDDPSITYTPVVWQATVNGHSNAANYDVETSMNNAASWLIFGPFDSCERLVTGKMLSAPIGVRAQQENSLIIEYVYPGTKADNLGLQAGDKLIKVDFKNKALKERFKYIPVNWQILDSFASVIDEKVSEYYITVERNGKRTNVTVPRIQTKISTMLLRP